MSLSDDFSRSIGEDREFERRAAKGLSAALARLDREFREMARILSSQKIPKKRMMPWSLAGWVIAYGGGSSGMGWSIGYMVLLTPEGRLVWCTTGTGGEHADTAPLSPSQLPWESRLTYERDALIYSLSRPYSGPQLEIKVPRDNSETAWEIIPPKMKGFWRGQQSLREWMVAVLKSITQTGRPPEDR
jgi:hypothetical protein